MIGHHVRASVQLHTHTFMISNYVTVVIPGSFKSVVVQNADWAVKVHLKLVGTTYIRGHDVRQEIYLPRYPR